MDRSNQETKVGPISPNLAKEYHKEVTTQRPGGLLADITIIVVISCLVISISYVRYTCAYNLGRTGLSHFSDISIIFTLAALTLTFCFLLLLLVRLVWTIPQRKARRLAIRLLFLLLVGVTAYGVVKWPWVWARRQGLRTGFLQRMQQETDVKAIREWWLTVRDKYEPIAYIHKQDWPEAVKELNPDYVKVGNIYDLPRYVQLTWSGGFADDFWGLNVGPESMNCPVSKKDNIEQVDYIPIAKGAHVFFIYFE